MYTGVSTEGLNEIINKLIEQEYKNIYIEKSSHNMWLVKWN